MEFRPTRRSSAPNWPACSWQPSAPFRTIRRAMWPTLVPGFRLCDLFANSAAQVILILWIPRHPTSVTAGGGDVGTDCWVSDGRLGKETKIGITSGGACAVTVTLPPKLWIRSMAPLNALPLSAFVTNLSTPLVPMPHRRSAPAMLTLAAASEAHVKTFSFFGGPWSERSTPL